VLVHRAGGPAAARSIALVPAVGRLGRLEHPPAWRHLEVGREQHDRAFRIRYTQHEHLGHEIGDLSRREVDDRDHLPADECFRRVVRGQLRTRLLLTDLSAEIDPQLERGLTRLLEYLGPHHAAGTDVHPFEVLPLDRPAHTTPPVACSSAAFAMPSRSRTNIRATMPSAKNGTIDELASLWSPVAPTTLA